MSETGLGSRFRVILVQPEREGNIGSIARAMKNFGLRELFMVSPRTPIGNETCRYARHGREILENARTVKTLADAIRGVKHVVGTTAIPGTSTRNLLRSAIAPEQLALRLAETGDSAALLFGRESSGLTNTELQQCDLIVTIPASEDYGTLNVAAAASIVFYELFKASGIGRSFRLEPPDQSVERLASIFSELAAVGDLPAHRKRLADRAFRNVLGKALISRREVSLIMGVLRRVRDKARSEAKKRTTTKRY